MNHLDLLWLKNFMNCIPNPVWLISVSDEKECQLLRIWGYSWGFAALFYFDPYLVYALLEENLMLQHILFLYQSYSGKVFLSACFLSGDA